MVNENLGFIKRFGVNESIIEQYIDLSDDSVLIKNTRNDSTLFVIDYSGYTKFIDKNSTEVTIGKFGYATGYFIKFEFDIDFLNTHKEITQDHILTDNKDFIEAERIVVDILLTKYPDIFTIKENNG